MQMISITVVTVFVTISNFKVDREGYWLRSNVKEVILYFI